MDEHIHVVKMMYRTSCVSLSRKTRDEADRLAEKLREEWPRYRVEVHTYEPVRGTDSDR